MVVEDSQRPQTLMVTALVAPPPGKSEQAESTKGTAIISAEAKIRFNMGMFSCTKLFVREQEAFYSALSQAL